MLAGREGRVIVMCAEGYSSSLAATALQDIGIDMATDMVGGFLAWQAAGLPATNGDGFTRYLPTGRAPGHRPT